MPPKDRRDASKRLLVSCEWRCGLQVPTDPRRTPDLGGGKPDRSQVKCRGGGAWRPYIPPIGMQCVTHGGTPWRGATGMPRATAFADPTAVTQQCTRRGFQSGTQPERFSGGMECVPPMPCCPTRIESCPKGFRAHKSVPPGDFLTGRSRIYPGKRACPPRPSAGWRTSALIPLEAPHGWRSRRRSCGTVWSSGWTARGPLPCFYVAAFAIHAKAVSRGYKAVRPDGKCVAPDGATCSVEWLMDTCPQRCRTTILATRKIG